MVAFAGVVRRVALEGATLRPDLDENADIYGKRLGNREIVTGGTACAGVRGETHRLLNSIRRMKKKAHRQ